MTSRRIRGFGVLVLAVVLAGAASVFAQPAPVSRVSVQAAMAGEEVLLSVAALDSAGNPVTGLQAPGFRVAIDDRQVTDIRVSTGVDTALPLALILVVDTSGSMAGAPIGAAREALRPLILAMGSSDRAAIISFDTTVNVQVPLTGDRAALVAGIESLQAVGNTALFSAVGQAVSISASATEPRKAIVLLSDGDDFGGVSTVTREQAVTAAVTSGVPFFVVGLGSSVNEQFLRDLNSSNLGEVFLTTNPQDLPRLYDTISSRLRLQYAIRFALPAGVAPGDHTVRVEVGGASGAAALRVAGAALSLAGLASELREETIVRLEGAPVGAQISFTLDGEPLEHEDDGVSVRLDPLLLEPGREHVLRAVFRDGTVEREVESRFDVAALPPRLVAPLEAEGLGAGDTLNVSFAAQPGAGVEAVFLIDGEERHRTTSPPYSFRIPDDGLTAGNHTVTVQLSSPGGSTEREFEFRAGGGSGGPGAPAVILFGLLAIAALAALGVGGRAAYRRFADREPALPAPDGATRLLPWTAFRRQRAGRASAAREPAPAPAAPSAWGRLIVVEGKGGPAAFSLVGETELVGRGKTCSVRLKDKAVMEAHFVVARGGQLFASTPDARVEVDGRPVRAVQLADGSQVRIGNTTLRFETLK